MRKSARKYLLITTLFLFLSCGSQNQGKLEGVDRIPNTAFWVENDGKGNWFDIGWINRHRNIAKISIYDGKTGDLIVKRKFITVCPVENMKYLDELLEVFDFYDGKNIQLKDNCYLAAKK